MQHMYFHLWDNKVIFNLDMLMPILSEIINKPLFTYLDKSIWILHTSILSYKPRAKFVQSLVHWGYPEKIATVKHW